MVGGEEGEGVDEEDETEEETEGAEDAGAGGVAERGAGHREVIDGGMMGGAASWSRDECFGINGRVRLRSLIC